MAGRRGGAHQPPSQPDPGGAFVTLNVRVAGEQQGAYAYKVVMQLPPGFSDVNLENVAGWTAQATITNLQKPAAEPGGPISQVVSQISWSGDRSTLGRIENGYFVQFPIEITIPSDLAGRSLTFKTVEYYSNGRNAYWIGPPSAAFPAPTINVTRAGGVIEDVAGTRRVRCPASRRSARRRSPLRRSRAPVPTRSRSSRSCSRRSR